MSTSTLWLETNQHYLVTHLERMRSNLAQFAGVSDWVLETSALQRSIQAAQDARPTPAALDRLRHLFDLSPFEQDVLLLCAGFEMDARFLRLCATAEGDSQRCDRLQLQPWSLSAPMVPALPAELDQFCWKKA